MHNVTCGESLTLKLFIFILSLWADLNSQVEQARVEELVDTLEKKKVEESNRWHFQQKQRVGNDRKKKRKEKEASNHYQTNHTKVFHHFSSVVSLAGSD